MLGYNFKKCMNSHQIKNNLIDFLQKKKKTITCIFIPNNFKKCIFLEISKKIIQFTFIKHLLRLKKI